jgi:hypothetical protein
LGIRDQVLHQLKATGKIILLYILNLGFLGRIYKDKKFSAEWYQAFPAFNLPLIALRK